jgi:hypothetical protein
LRSEDAGLAGSSGDVAQHGGGGEERAADDGEVIAPLARSCLDEHRLTKLPSVII